MLLLATLTNNQTIKTTLRVYKASKQAIKKVALIKIKHSTLKKISLHPKIIYLDTYIIIIIIIIY